MELLNQSNLISSFINETCSLFESQIEFNRYCMNYHHSVSEKFQNLKILGETLLKMNSTNFVPIPKPSTTMFTPSTSPNQLHQRLNHLDSEYNKNKSRNINYKVLNSIRSAKNENERLAQQRLLQNNQSSIYRGHITPEPETDHFINETTSRVNNDINNQNKENLEKYGENGAERRNTNSIEYHLNNNSFSIKNEGIETIESFSNNCPQNSTIDNFCDSGTDGRMTSSSINDEYPSQQEDTYSMDFNRVISEQDLLAIEHAKPFKCTECFKTFRMKEELKIHFRVHSGERPFKCNECDKSFKQSTDLKRHILVHTGEKKYRCPQCGKHFTLLGNMRLHQRRIHPQHSHNIQC